MVNIRFYFMKKKFFPVRIDNNKLMLLKKKKHGEHLPTRLHSSSNDGNVVKIILVLFVFFLQVRFNKEKLFNTHLSLFQLFEKQTYEKNFIFSPLIRKHKRILILMIIL